MSYIEAGMHDSDQLEKIILPHALLKKSIGIHAVDVTRPTMLKIQWRFYFISI